MKIKNYAVGTAKPGDKIVATDADTNETKNLLISSITGVIDELVTEEFEITAEDLIALGDTPIVLKAAPGSTKYYEWEARVEFISGITPYTFADDMLFIGSSVSLSGSNIATSFITDGDKIHLARPEPTELSTVGDKPITRPFGKNEGIIFKTVNDTNPENGDGTIKIFLSYIERTFGQ